MLREPVGRGRGRALELICVGREVAAVIELQPLWLASAVERRQGEIRRADDIRVADYHANLIYNAGEGTARQLREVIQDLKRRVHDRFGLDLEEEVQYIGFRNGTGSIS